MPVNTRQRALIKERMKLTGESRADATRYVIREFNILTAREPWIGLSLIDVKGDR